MTTIAQLELRLQGMQVALRRAQDKIVHLEDDVWHAKEAVALLHEQLNRLAPKGGDPMKKSKPAKKGKGRGPGGPPC